MRRRLTVMFLLGVLTVTTGSAGTANATRDIRAVAETTAVTLVLAGKAGIVPRTVATFTGRVTPAEAQVPIEVWVKRFYQPAFTLFNRYPPTTSDGRFSFTMGLSVRTAFQVRVPAAAGTTEVVSSNVVTVVVPAEVALFDARNSSSPNQFSVSVGQYDGYPFLKGKFVLIQIRRAGSSARWLTLRRVTLRPGGKTSTFTFFSLSLPRGTSFLRAHLPATQAAPNYLAGTSDGRLKVTR